MQANSVMRPESRGSTVDRLFQEKNLFPPSEEPCPTIVGSQSIHSTANQHTKTLLNVKQNREPAEPPVWREGYPSPNQWLQLAQDGTLPAYKYEDSIYRKKPAFRAIAKDIERRYKEQIAKSPVKYLSPMKTEAKAKAESKVRDKHREYIMKKSPNAQPQPHPQRISNFQLYVEAAAGEPRSDSRKTLPPL